MNRFDGEYDNTDDEFFKGIQIGCISLIVGFALGVSVGFLIEWWIR